MIEPFDLYENAAGKLVLTRAGLDDVTDVRLRRAFPWTLADRYISLRDSTGKEVLLVDDLATLPAALRAKVEAALATHSFIPLIQKIEHVDVRFGHQQWTVVTDRGRAEFRVQEREDIRFLNDGRFSIKDADGNVFALPRLRDLDAHSRRAVEAVL